MMVSAGAFMSRSCTLAFGRVTCMRECWMKVLVSTKNISRVSSTSINGTTLISNSSWRRSLPMRMESARARRDGCRRAARTRRHRRTQGQLVQQRGGLLLHLHAIAGHARTEPAVQHVGGDRHGKAGGGADQRLADAAGHLRRV